MSLYDSLERYVKENRGRFESWLGRLVEVPTVSMDPQCQDDMRRGASVAVELLTALGADASVVEAGGHPLVIGGWKRDPQWPTVAIYNHLDVQPAMEPEWTRAPFKFAVDGDFYFGRGTTDDKGPALTALLAANYAVEQNMPLNIEFCWELEEEIGSPNFGQGLSQAFGLVRPDSVVVSDTVWLAGKRPAIPYGLRGLLAARLTLETAIREAHSGLTGGAARNPLAELCAAIAACVDAKTGRVKIPGFYDKARRAGKKEQNQFRKSGFDVKSFAAEQRLTKLRANDRGGRHDGGTLARAGDVLRPQPSRPWVSRPQRAVRLGTGSGRDQDVREVLRRNQPHPSLGCLFGDILRRAKALRKPRND